MPLNHNDRTLARAGESRRLAQSKERPSTATSRESSQQRGGPALNPANQRGPSNAGKAAVSREEEDALRVPVKNTLGARSTSFAMKRNTSQSTEDEKENDQAYYVKKETDAGAWDRGRSDRYGHEDDDTSITYGSTGWDAEQDVYGQETTIFRGGDYNPLAADINSPSLQPEARNAATARKGLQTANQTSSRFQHGRNNDPRGDEDLNRLLDDESDDEGEDARRLARDTPSRARAMPPVKKALSQSKLPNAKQVNFVVRDDLNGSSSPIDRDESREQQGGFAVPLKPEINPYTSLARHKAHRQELKQQAVSEPPKAPPVNSNVAAKVSALHEGQEEELQNPFQPLLAGTATKRLHEEIDYSFGDLTAKPYSALDEVPFHTDPRAPAMTAHVDQSGNTLQNLHDKLRNLSNMRPEDQRNLFSSLADDENEQTGQYFINSFGSSLKQLMEKRVERRKIALKYELEAKKRQKAVEAKTEDCENELSELKTGGHKLVEGRSAAKIGMTPRKAASMPPAQEATAVEMRQ